MDPTVAASFHKRDPGSKSSVQSDRSRARVRTYGGDPAVHPAGQSGGSVMAAAHSPGRYSFLGSLRSVSQSEIPEVPLGECNGSGEAECGFGSQLGGRLYPSASRHGSHGASGRIPASGESGDDLGHRRAKPAVLPQGDGLPAGETGGVSPEMTIDHMTGKLINES